VASTVEEADESVGDILLRMAGDADAGLLVMGAYGHSRLSEFILGGVTRTVLRDTKCPVFISH
jgi:nucleotide-binding universal stress UspA family protein